jgi:fibronectin type 3 domain-containing protein
LIVTPQAPIVTAPPTNLTATGAKRKISLNWTQSSTPGIVQNKIYRSTTSNGTYALLATIAAATSYSDSVSTGTTYYYVVTAVSSSGESATSNSAGATAK